MESTTPIHKLRTRTYQQEMLDRSLRGNVVVVLDTGSGKTLIAALRIKAELERCPSTQRVWFLGPGVDLCKQQHAFLSEFLPSINTRLLIGADNVDRWRDQHIWDAALDQVRLVVSTYAVLRDALDHRFVQLQDLALIIFDEAHHCAKKSPANAIMQNTYHPAKRDGIKPLPHILGLTASMIKKSDIKSSRVLEANLDAISITPRVHRDELAKHVNKPTYTRLEYSTNYNPPSQSEPIAVHALVQVKNTVGELLSSLNGPSTSIYSDVREYINRLCRKVCYFQETLGLWAVDHFLHETVRAYRSNIGRHKNDSTHTSNRDFEHSVSVVVKALETEISKIAVRLALDDNCLTPKVLTLLDFLSTKSGKDTTGIIFVERRTTTRLICDLLTQHPSTRDKFRVAPYASASGHYSKRNDPDDLVDVDAQKDTLARFRNGDLNLLVATNTLEEGIDVQSCNLVVSFDPPANLKAFIQRRGRARQMQSELVLMVSKDDLKTNLHLWLRLESQLIELCQQDRQLDDEQEPEEDEHADRALIHPVSGATITLYSAAGHLHHFCALLPPQPYVDFRPEFSYDTDGQGLIQASVVLPSCIHGISQEFVSDSRWESELGARRDVSLVAYKGLYKAHLLNEHLLPLLQDWSPQRDFDEIEPGKVEVPQLINVWRMEGEENHRYESIIRMWSPAESEDCDWRGVSIKVLTARSLWDIPKLSPVRWASEEGFKFDIPDGERIVTQPQLDLGLYSRTTETIFRAARSDRLSLPSDNLEILFGPGDAADFGLWLASNAGRVKISQQIQLRERQTVVRMPFPNNPPGIFHGTRTNSQQPKEIVCEPLKSFGKNHTLHPIDFSAPGSKYVSCSTEICEVDRISSKYVRLSSFLPKIFTHIQDYLVADALEEQIFSRGFFNSSQRLLTAICSPTAARGIDYQRLEFVGDCVLKYVVSCHLYAAHWTWPEGYLTKRRQHLISNERLAFEAIRLQLGQFIIVDPVKFKDWTPCSPQSDAISTRKLPTKLLADVIEALIGATFLDKNMSFVEARYCVNLLIPSISKEDPPFKSPPPPPTALVQGLNDAEDLIGRSFQNKGLLLEALTLSAGSSTYHCESYQRLEFLGDAIIDMLVVQNMLLKEDRKNVLSQGQSTSIRAALVNRYLLGYFCLHFRQTNSRNGVVTDGHYGSSRIVTMEKESQIWHYLRHDSEDLVHAQRETNQRYTVLADKIAASLLAENNEPYPWVDLLELNPEKYYSDLIESITGAIFVDSGGDLKPCQEFLDRIGLTAYLHLMISQCIDATHPRDRFQKLVGQKKFKFKFESDEHDTDKESTERVKVGKLIVEEEVIAIERVLGSEKLAIAHLSLVGIAWLKK